MYRSPREDGVVHGAPPGWTEAYARSVRPPGAAAAGRRLRLSARVFTQLTASPGGTVGSHSNDTISKPLACLRELIAHELRTSGEVEHRGTAVPLHPRQVPPAGIDWFLSHCSHGGYFYHLQGTGPQTHCDK
jgi:hypothetical protein